MQNLRPLPLGACRMLSGILFIWTFAGQATQADELKGHVQSSSTPRLSRPPVKDEALTESGSPGATPHPRALDAQLDDGCFQLNARSNQTNLDLSNWNPWSGASTNNLRPFNRLAVHRPMLRPAGIAHNVLTGEDSDLAQTERCWQGSVTQFDAGCSRVQVSANIAFCPPRDPVMREDWRTLMRELQNEATAAMWRQWQDNVCQQLMESRKLKAMTFGNMQMHISINNNGDIQIGGFPSGVMDNTFADSCKASANGLKKAGWLALPTGSAVHQAHVRVSIWVRPNNMP